MNPLKEIVPYVGSINGGDISHTFEKISHSSKAYKQALEGRIRSGLEFILPHKVQQISSQRRTPQTAYVNINMRHHFRSYNRDCMVIIKIDLWKGSPI